MDSTRLIVMEVNGDEAKVRQAQGTTNQIPLSSLPHGVQPGDFLRVTESDGQVKMEIEWLGAAH